MYSQINHVHTVYMPKSRRTRLKPVPDKNFIREWRKHRHLTLEQLVERLREAQGVAITHASLSRIERGRQPYGEPILAALARELTGGDKASLLMRDPSDPEGIWSLWDQAKPAQRKTIVEVVKTLLKTGT